MDQPTTIAELVEELTALPDLDPIARARRCPALIDAAKAVLAQERAAAMRTALDRTRPGWVTQDQLATDLGVSRTAITKVLARDTPPRAPQRQAD